MKSLNVTEYRPDKKYPPIAGKPFVERKTIHAVIFDPIENKIACLHWKEFPWITFVVGGVDEDEDPVDAAKREVLEETGYRNLKFIKYLNKTPVIAEYYAAHKGQNRRAYTDGILFELENHDQDELSREEHEKFDLNWHPRSEIANLDMTCAEFDIWLEGLREDG